jgi:hypothetical protein
VAYSYQAITTDSNLLPIAILVRREGVFMPSLGVEVTVTVKERGTGDIIVEDAEAIANDDVVGRWDYWFAPEAVAAITENTTWLIEWKIVSGEFTWRSPEPATLAIRKKL